jgi:ubiquinone biosynthesis protein COQ4
MSARNPIRLREARAAMRELLENPDDTAQAFKVIAAMSGGSGERLYRRFRRSPTGARILDERRNLVDLIGDVGKLRAMPANSLGQALADFYESEELSAQGLVAASEAGLSTARDGLDEERRVFGNRLRDLHDVFHVVGGYGRDLLGEASVLAFTFAQTWNLGIGFLLFVVLRRTGLRSEPGRMIREGFRRGRRATWLVDLDWEALLLQPIDRLRQDLRLGPLPIYQPVRSAGAPAEPRALSTH